MADKPSFLQEYEERVYSSERNTGFDTQELEKHQQDFSIETLWEKSYLCPCRNPDTRSADPNCRQCEGRGIAFMPPKPEYMMLQGNKQGSYNGEYGVVDQGTALATPERDTRISFRDRITVPDVAVSQSVIFNVNEKRVEHGFFLQYDVREIEYIRTFHNELVEKDSMGNGDYKFSMNENRIYPDEKYIGENISLNILTTLRYLVTDLRKAERHQIVRGKTEKQSQLLVLKREDLFIGSEAFEMGMKESDMAEVVDPKRKPESMDGLNGFFR